MNDLPNKKETQREVAAALDCSCESLRLWKKLRGAPSGWNIEEWRAFVEAQGLKKAQSKSLADLKVLIAEEELRKKRRENEIQDGQLVPVSEIEDFMRTMAARFDVLLTQKLDTELPSRVLGKPISEIRVEVRAIHDEIRDITQRGLLEWRASE